MNVTSLGYRTDLMLLRLQGGVAEPRDGHLAVRTPADPSFRWGNFLLLAGPPAPGTVGSWVTAFRREFPDAGHLALGVDGVAGEAGDAAELGAADLEIGRSTVLTAGSVRPPPRPNRDARFRVLDGDEDWRAALALQEASRADAGAEGYRVFSRRRMAAMRRLQERGHGAWFGAFADGRMLCGLGVFTDGSRIARFQSVETHPAHRNRGLAGTLVHLAGRHALERLGARTLVMVADPGHAAIRVYHSVGFNNAETQTQIEPKS